MINSLYTDLLFLLQLVGQVLRIITILLLKKHSNWSKCLLKNTTCRIMEIITYCCKLVGSFINYSDKRCQCTVQVQSHGLKIYLTIKIFYVHGQNLLNLLLNAASVYTRLFSWYHNTPPTSCTVAPTLRK